MRVDLRGVTKRFGKMAALQGVNLSIPSGRRVALIGPNGSGKSTLTRILMGIMDCEGEVLLDGLSPFHERAAIARRMAYVPQVAPQLGAPVQEVVNAVAEIREMDVAEIRRVADRLDLDLSLVAHRPVRALSGGTKQKLLIALAFANRSSLLILDEPTASLDASARQRFFELFEEYAGDATLVLCSHRLEEVRHMVDHVVALDGGRLTFDGPVDEILQGRARSVVELYTADDGCAPFLSGLGFSRGVRGAWAMTVSQAEKAALLKKVVSTLDGGLKNVLIHDLEAIDSAPAEDEMQKENHHG